MRPSIYVASSWRNTRQPDVVRILRALDTDVYDFRNPSEATGFSWREVKPDYDGPAHAGEVRQKGEDWVSASEYLAMVHHDRAQSGFKSDMDALRDCDSCIMVLPCGKSAHLELGWAIGAGKRTAILLEDPIEPELMYLAADHLISDLGGLVEWGQALSSDGVLRMRKP